MARGAMSHLALVVTDLAAATAFYDAVLAFMGYARVPVPESTQALMKTVLIAYSSASWRDHDSAGQAGVRRDEVSSRIGRA